MLFWNYCWNMIFTDGPRLVMMWLILHLARNRCSDSENQDTIDNSLSWRYIWFEWHKFLGGLNSWVPSLYIIPFEPASHLSHQLALNAMSTYLPRFCLVLCSIFITELEFELYCILCPNLLPMWLAHSQAKTQHCYSFTTWLASIFTSTSSI